MKIGILALQGAFIEHVAVLDRVGVESVQIRRREQFTDALDGLILPGGESTVMGKFLREEGMLEPVKARIEAGMPVFGTCAGLILLARRVSNDTRVGLGTMDITVKRNAYGRQLGSFERDIRVRGIGDFPCVFIRAPYIELVGPDVEVLAEADGHIVAAREGNQLVTAFHPELTRNKQFHTYFVNMIRDAQRA